MLCSLLNFYARLSLDWFAVIDNQSAISTVVAFGIIGETIQSKDKTNAITVTYNASKSLMAAMLSLYITQHDSKFSAQNSCRF